MRALFSKLLMLQTWSLVLQSLNEMFYSLYHISKFSTYYYFMSYFLPHNTLNFLFRFLTSALKKNYPYKIFKNFDVQEYRLFNRCCNECSFPEVDYSTLHNEKCGIQKMAFGFEKKRVED